MTWIDELSAIAREDMLAKARERSFPGGTVLYSQGSATTELFQIVSGKVRRSMLNARGQEVLLNVHEEGDALGYCSAIDGAPFMGTLTTQGPTRLLSWSNAAFAELRERHREIDTQIVHQLSRTVREVCQVFEQMGTLAVPGRVAARIALIVEARGSIPAGEPLDLSQSDLALMLRTTRPSVNRVVLELKERGLIDTQYGRIVVKDLAGLRSFAASTQLHREPRPARRGTR